MLKRNAMLLLVSSMLLLLTACGAAATPETIVETVEVVKEVTVVETVEVEKVVEVEVTVAAEEPAAGEPVEVSVVWWGSQDRHERTVKALELFNEQHSDIQVTYEFSSWGDYWTKLTTQAAGGNLPCVIQSHAGALAEWVDNDLIIPLEPLVESGHIDLSNVSETPINLGRYNGVLYAIDLGDNSQTIALDIDAFEEAGVELPPRDWTWAQFEETAIELHDKLGIWGIGPELTTWQPWDAYLRGYGKTGFSDDGTALGYSEEDDQYLIDYLAMHKRLEEAGVTMPFSQEIAEARGKSVEDKPIVKGQAAMDYFWSNQVVAVWTAAGEDRNFALYHLPRPEGGGPTNFLKSAMNFTISSHCENPEAAATVIDFFTNSIEANEILLAERGVPISTEVQEALQPLLGPAQIEMFKYVALVAEDGSPTPLPFPAQASDIETNVYYPEFVDPVMLGLISPEEGVATFREMATEILAEQ